jgi:site-specific recombinase XerD
MPISELLARYRADVLPTLAPNSVSSYGTSLDAAYHYFVTLGGDPSAHELRPGHVQAFMSWRRTHSKDGAKVSPLSQRTINRDRVVFGVVLSYGERMEVVVSNPVRRTKAPKGDSRQPLILTDQQYEALIAACEGRPMLALYVLLLGETGLRCESEALWLRWADVDVEGGFLTVEGVRKGVRSKSGRSRVVPMTARLRSAMREHMATFRMVTYGGERSPWIFHHALRRRHAEEGTRITGLRRAFRSAVERAGLPADLHQHDLRHRRVTTWLDAGHPAHIVQLAMGHSDIKTTMGYAHLTETSLRRLVDEPDRTELRRLG